MAGYTNTITMCYYYTHVHVRFAPWQQGIIVFLHIQEETFK